MIKYSVNKTFLGFMGILLLALTLYLPGFTNMPMLDRDSAHFSAATQSMIQSNDYWHVRYHGEPRQRKPPGYYWLQALSVQIGNNNLYEPFAYRWPSLIASLLSIFLCYYLARIVTDKETSRLAAGFLAVTTIVVMEAHLTTTDACLLVSVLLMQIGLAKLYLQQNQNTLLSAFLFWIGLASGFLIKGVAPLMAVLTLFGLAISDKDIRWWRRLRWDLGLLTIAGLVFLLHQTNEQSGDTLFWVMLSKDFIPKLLHPMESHGAPPGYYWALFPLLAYPGSIALWHGIHFAKEQINTPAIRFLLAFMISYGLTIEMIPTKLPQYLMPLLPAVSILMAQGMKAAAITPFPWPRLLRIHYAYWFGINSLIPLAIIFLPYLINDKFNLAYLIIGILLILGNYSLLQAYKNKQNHRVFIAMFVLPALQSITLFTFLLPSLKPLWITEQLLAYLPPKQTLVSLGYEEPSLVFRYPAKSIIFATPENLQQNLTAKSYLFIDSRYQKSFAASLKNHHATLITTFNGYVYNKGRWKTFQLFYLES